MRTAVESAARQVEAAEQLQEAAQRAIASAEQKLAEQRTKAAQGLVTLRTVVDLAWSKTKSEIEGSKLVKESGVLDQFGESVGNAERLRARVAEIRARPVRLLSELGWGKALAFAAFVLALPPAAWVAGKFLNTESFGQAVTLISALLSSIGLWLKSAQIVIAVLVIGTGAQLDAAGILSALAEWDPRDSYEDVIEQLRSHQRAEWILAARVLETLRRTQKASNVTELRGWARKVGRFLLRGPITTFRHDISDTSSIGA